MREDEWMSEVDTLKIFKLYTFRVSGLLTTENDDFIYLLLLKINTTITHLNSIFHWEKKHQVKLISRF